MCLKLPQQFRLAFAQFDELGRQRLALHTHHFRLRVERNAESLVVNPEVNQKVISRLGGRAKVSDPESAEAPVHRRVSDSADFNLGRRYDAEMAPFTGRLMSYGHGCHI
jgi:hypothetical protein